MLPYSVGMPLLSSAQDIGEGHQRINYISVAAHYNYAMEMVRFCDSSAPIQRCIASVHQTLISVADIVKFITSNKGSPYV